MKTANDKIARSRLIRCQLVEPRHCQEKRISSLTLLIIFDIIVIVTVIDNNAYAEIYHHNGALSDFSNYRSIEQPEP